MAISEERRGTRGGTSSQYLSDTEFRHELFNNH